ncbi:MAG: hypothetical protein GY768_29575 [Planctomycetaceae bacterium]|nr:hypothetical protein [Planctomycetaceae bacterium]
MTDVTIVQRSLYPGGEVGSGQRSESLWGALQRYPAVDNHRDGGATAGHSLDSTFVFWAREKIGDPQEDF